MIKILRKIVQKLAFFMGMSVGTFHFFYSRRDQIKHWPACYLKNLFNYFCHYLRIYDYHRKMIPVHFKKGYTLFFRSDTLSAIETFDHYKKYISHLDLNGKVVIDIGAHVGSFAVPAVFYGARVYAFEPDPYNFRVLEEARRVNHMEGRLSIFQQAVSRGKGESTFYEGGHSTVGTLTTDEFFQEKRRKNSNNKAFTVKISGINDIFEENNIEECYWLKIDCEGSEYDIFRAFDDKHLKKVKYVYVETHPSDQEGNTNALIEEKLKLCGLKEVVRHPIENGCYDLVYARD